MYCVGIVLFLHFMLPSCQLLRTRLEVFKLTRGDHTWTYLQLATVWCNRAMYQVFHTL